MSVLPGANGKKSVPLRVTSQILVFLLLAGLSALALRPLQRFVHRETTAIRDNIIGRAEAFLGRELSYASIRPNIFGAFDIRGIQVSGDGDALLSVARLRVSWSLWNLLRGNGQVIRSVLVDRPRINLDLEKDRGLFERLSRLAENSGGGQQDDFASLLPGDAALRIRGGQLLVRDARNLYSVGGLHGDVQIREGQIALNGRWSGGVSLPGVPEDFTVRYNMRLSGSYALDTNEGEAVFTVPFVRGDSFRLHPLSFDLGFSGSRLTLAKSPDGVPWDFALDCDVAGETFSARYKCDDFILNDILSFEGDWKEASAWLTLVTSGEAALERKRGGSLAYSVDLEGEGTPDSDEGSFVVRANGSEQRAEIRQFSFFAPRSGAVSASGPFSGGVEYRGAVGFSPFAPEGVLSLTDVNFSGEGNINAELTVGSRENSIDIFSETLDIGGVSFAALDVVVIPSENGIDLAAQALRFRNLESYSDVRLSTVSLDGTLDYEPRQLAATLRLDSFSAADLGGMSRPFTGEKIIPAFADGILENTAITTEVFFDTDFEHILYNAPRFVIALESAADSSVSSTMRTLNLDGIQNAVGLVSISGTDHRFELSEGRFIWNGNSVSINGFADYTDPLDISFSLMSNYRDLSYYLEGSVLDRRSLSIQGSYGLEIYISSGDNGSYSGYIQARDIPVPFPEQPGHLTFLSSVRYDSSDFWSVDLDRFDLLNIGGPAGAANLQITGGADQDGGYLHRIYYSDSRGPLNGTAGFSWGEDPAESDIDRRFFAGTVLLEGGNEQYHLSAGYRENHIEISLSGSGMQLGRLSPRVYNALAEGDIQIDWNMGSSFRAELSLYSLRAKIQERELDARARVTLDGLELSVEDFRIGFANLEGRIPLFRMNLAEGRVETGADFSGYAAGRWLDGIFSVEAQFSPVESWLSLPGALDSFKGSVHVQKIQYADLTEFTPFDVVFARSNGGFSVSGGPRNMLRIHADSQGNFYAALSAPSVIMGSVTGTISGNNIDAYSGDLYIDLGGLWQLVPPQPDFALAGGYASAQVAIRGPLGDPEFFGTVKGTSVSIQIPRFITRDIRPVPFTAAITGNEIVLNNIPANVGSGGGTVSGWFRFDRWVPNIFELDIFVPSRTPIPFGFDITGFLAAGDVSGHLIVGMENLAFDIKGDLFANNTEIGLNSDEIVSAQGQDLFANTKFPVVVDIAVNTGPTVEFLWPSSNFPILRANPDIGTKVNVSADSTTGQFSVNTDINIRSGEIFYFERSFYIRSGILSFRENEIRFDPRLSVRAEARDRNDDGPVTISMIVDNAPLLSFTARFESNPSLSQAEIFALLGQNLTGSQIDADTGNIQRAFLSSGVDALAQFVVVRQAERQLRKWTHLDMLSFRTQILQNAFFNATGLRQTPVDRNVGVGNYFDNTTVFLGKYIGANMFVQTMLAMRYDENKTSLGGLSLEWDIGLEFQTPILNIRWDFIPTHPENWFVDDNSITLTWRKTF